MGADQKPIMDIEKYKQEDEFEITMRVGEEYAKGFSAQDIAQRLEISRRDVNKHIALYKKVVLWAAKNDMNIADKISVVIEEVDHHYKMVVNEAWKNKENAEFEGSTNIVNSALSLIAKVQSQRAKMFQEFSDGADVELLAELEETQRRQDQLIKILKNLKTKFPQAAAYIQSELARVTEEPDEIDVEILPGGPRTKAERAEKSDNE